MTPRGIRNNNPGNVRVGSPWQGLALSSDMTPEQRKETEFCVFQSPEWGIRAMVRILQTYRKRDGIPGVGNPRIDTVREVIHRWAPQSENDTGAYVAAVAESMAVLPDDPIDLTDPQVLRPLIKGIIQHENGRQPYGDAVIMSGIALANLSGGDSNPASKDRDSAAKSTTIQASGGIIATAAGTIATAITGTSGLAQILLVIFAFIIAAAGFWVMKERLKKWADGVR